MLPLELVLFQVTVTLLLRRGESLAIHTSKSVGSLTGPPIGICCLIILVNMSLRMSVTETTDVDRKVLWVEVTTIIVSFCEVVHEGVVRKLSVETVTFLKIVEIYWIGPVGV